MNTVLRKSQTIVTLVFFLFQIVGEVHAFPSRSMDQTQEVSMYGEIPVSEATPETSASEPSMAATALEWMADDPLTESQDYDSGYDQEEYEQYMEDYSEDYDDSEYDYEHDYEDYYENNGTDEGLDETDDGDQSGNEDWETEEDVYYLYDEDGRVIQIVYQSTGQVVDITYDDVNQEYIIETEGVSYAVGYGDDETALTWNDVFKRLKYTNERGELIEVEFDEDGFPILVMNHTLGTKIEMTYDFVNAEYLVKGDLESGWHLHKARLVEVTSTPEGAPLPVWEITIMPLDMLPEGDGEAMFNFGIDNQPIGQDDRMSFTIIDNVKVEYDEFVRPIRVTDYNTGEIIEIKYDDYFKRYRVSAENYELSFSYGDDNAPFTADDWVFMYRYTDEDGQTFREHFDENGLSLKVIHLNTGLSINLSYDYVNQTYTVQGHVDVAWNVHKFTQHSFPTTGSSRPLPIWAISVSTISDLPKGSTKAVFGFGENVEPIDDDDVLLSSWIENIEYIYDKNRRVVMVKDHDNGEVIEIIYDDVSKKYLVIGGDVRHVIWYGEDGEPFTNDDIPFQIHHADGYGDVLETTFADDGLPIFVKNLTTGLSIEMSYDFEKMEYVVEGALDAKWTLHKLTKTSLPTTGFTPSPIMWAISTHEVGGLHENTHKATYSFGDDEEPISEDDKTLSSWIENIEYIYDKNRRVVMVKDHDNGEVTEIIYDDVSKKYLVIGGDVRHVIWYGEDGEPFTNDDIPFQIHHADGYGHVLETTFADDGLPIFVKNLTTGLSIEMSYDFEKMEYVVEGALDAKWTLHKLTKTSSPTTGFTPSPVMWAISTHEVGGLHENTHKATYSFGDDEEPISEDDKIVSSWIDQVEVFYDERGRVIRVVDHDTEEVSLFAYDDVNMRFTITTGNIVQTIAYGSDERPVTKDDIYYQLIFIDENGDRIEETFSEDGRPVLVRNLTQDAEITFAYDDESELYIVNGNLELEWQVHKFTVVDSPTTGMRSNNDLPLWRVDMITIGGLGGITSARYSYGDDHEAITEDDTLMNENPLESAAMERALEDMVEINLETAGGALSFVDFGLLDLEEQVGSYKQYYAARIAGTDLVAWGLVDSETGEIMASGIAKDSDETDTIKTIVTELALFLTPNSGFNKFNLGNFIRQKQDRAKISSTIRESMLHQILDYYRDNQSYGGISNTVFNTIFRSLSFEEDALIRIADRVAVEYPLEGVKDTEQSSDYRTIYNAIYGRSRDKLNINRDEKNEDLIALMQRMVERLESVDATSYYVHDQLLNVLSHYHLNIPGDHDEPVLANQNPSIVSDWINELFENQIDLNGRNAAGNTSLMRTLAKIMLDLVNFVDMDQKQKTMAQYQRMVGYVLEIASLVHAQDLHVYYLTQVVNAEGMTWLGQTDKVKIATLFLDRHAGMFELWKSELEQFFVHMLRGEHLDDEHETKVRGLLESALTERIEALLLESVPGPVAPSPGENQYNSDLADIIRIARVLDKKDLVLPLLDKFLTPFAGNEKIPAESAEDLSVRSQKVRDLWLDTGIFIQDRSSFYGADHSQLDKLTDMIRVMPRAHFQHLTMVTLVIDRDSAFASALNNGRIIIHLKEKDFKNLTMVDINGGKITKAFNHELGHVIHRNMFRKHRIEWERIHTRARLSDDWDNFLVPITYYHKESENAAETYSHFVESNADFLERAINNVSNQKPILMEYYLFFANFLAEQRNGVEVFDLFETTGEDVLLGHLTMRKIGEMEITTRDERNQITHFNDGEFKYQVIYEDGKIVKVIKKKIVDLVIEIVHEMSFSQGAKVIVEKHTRDDQEQLFLKIVAVDQEILREEEIASYQVAQDVQTARHIYQVMTAESLTGKQINITFYSIPSYNYEWGTYTEFEELQLPGYGAARKQTSLRMVAGQLLETSVAYSRQETYTWGSYSYTYWRPFYTQSMAYNNDGTLRYRYMSYFAKDGSSVSLYETYSKGVVSYSYIRLRDRNGRYMSYRLRSSEIEYNQYGLVSMIDARSTKGFKITVSASAETVKYAVG